MTTFSPAAGAASREAALRTSVITGVIDTLVCLTAVLAARSSLLLADFLKTLLEAVAVTLSWLAIRRINRGADARFEYGLGKMENLTSLLVGAVMSLCLLVIVANSIRNILHPGHIAGIGVWIGLGDQVFYGVINGVLCLRGFREARQNASPLMASQARLLLTRTIGNAFILVSLVLSLALARYGWSRFIDPAASLVVAGSILMAALGIFQTSVQDLLDRSLEESDQILILRELARHFDDYEMIHGIRSRRAGAEAFVEILLEFDPEKKVAEVQRAADGIRASIESKIRNSRVTIGLSNGPVAPV